MATLPQKLFDVRNGNNCVDADATAYPAATVIVFKDAAAKNKVVDSFATAYGYQATIPDPANPGQTINNPQSKQAFYNARLTDFIRDIYRSVTIRAAEVAAAVTAKTNADGELP